MAKARKCDRCGKLYESYNVDNDNKTMNAMYLINVDDNGKYWSREHRDICPDCCEEFMNWYRACGKDINGEDYIIPEEPKEPEGNDKKLTPTDEPTRNNEVS